MGYLGGDRPRSASSGTNAAVDVTTTATLLAAANESRVCLTLQPTDAALVVGFSSSVTADTGLEVPMGQSFDELYYTGAVYGIVADGTADVRVAEVG